MKHVIAFFGKRAVTVCLLILALFAVAALALFRVSGARYPLVPERDLIVDVVAPGRNPEELRDVVALPLERALADSPGRDSITTVVRDGRVSFRMRYAWGTDMNAALESCRDTLDRVYPGLPQGIARPRVEVARRGEERIMLIAIHSVDGDPVEASECAEKELLPRIRALEGVAGVSLLGAARKRYVLRVSPDRLLPLGLDVSTLARLLVANTLECSAGRVQEGEHEWDIRIAGKPQSPDALVSLQIPISGGRGIQVGDIARIEEEVWRPEGFFADENGLSTALAVSPVPGSNSVALSRKIHRTCEDFLCDTGGAFTLTVLEDEGAALREDLSFLIISPLVILLAGFLILCFFPGPCRRWECFCYWLVMPLSMSVSIIVVALFGGRLETLSMGGISLSPAMACGLLLLYQDPFRGASLNMDRFAERSGIALLATGAGCLVLSPLILFPGPLQSLQGGFIHAVLPAFVLAWVYAFLFFPAIVQRTGRALMLSAPLPSLPGDVSGFKERIRTTFLRRAHHPLRRAPVIVFVMMVCAIPFFARGGVRFLPEEKLSGLIVSLDWPAGTSRERIELESAVICRQLGEDSALSRVRGSGGALSSVSQRYADPLWHPERLQIMLALSGKRHEPVEALMRHLEAQCARLLPTVLCTVEPASHPLEDLVRPAFTGGAGRTTRVLRMWPKTGALGGIGLADMAQTLYAKSEGLELFDILDAGVRYPVLLKAEQALQEGVDFRNVAVIRQDGTPFFVGGVVDTALDEQCDTILRQDNEEVESGIPPTDEPGYRRDFLRTGLSALALLWLLIAAATASLFRASKILGLLLFTVLATLPLMTLLFHSLDAGSFTGLLLAVAWLSSCFLSLSGRKQGERNKTVPFPLALSMLLLAGLCLALYSHERVLRTTAFALCTATLAGGLGIWLAGGFYQKRIATMPAGGACEILAR